MRDRNLYRFGIIGVRALFFVCLRPVFAKTAAKAVLSLRGGVVDTITNTIECHYTKQRVLLR